MAKKKKIAKKKVAQKAAARSMKAGSLKRLDNVAIVVEDLPAAIAFFVELGLRLEGEMPLEGGLVDRLIDLEGVQVDIAMLRTPDGQGIELTRYRRPRAAASPPPPVNAPGIRRLMFAVEDLQGVVARLRARGADLVGTIERYEDAYELCYLRGPEGILIALAEELG